MSNDVGKYFSDTHEQPKPNPDRDQLLKKYGELYRKHGILEGLSSLKYQVVYVEKTLLFKRIYVNYIREDY